VEGFVWGCITVADSTQEEANLTREAGVVDMMLSVHALLAQRYQRRNRTLDVVTLAGSVLLNATVFVGAAPADTVEEHLLRGVSVALFFLTLLPLVVGWKDDGNRHSDACRELSKLKDELRKISSPQSAAEFRESYCEVMEAIPQIPETQFVALKAHHYRKVALSRLISKYPGAPLWLLRLRLLRNDAKAVINADIATDK
jgi:hypothetical protein